MKKAAVGHPPTLGALPKPKKLGGIIFIFIIEVEEQYDCDNEKAEDTS